MPTAIGKRSAEAIRAFQLYSLVDICSLGTTWSHCKRRATSMLFWEWAPLPNVLGLLGLPTHASPNGQYGEEILALMSAITMMNPNYIVM